MNEPIPPVQSPLDLSNVPQIMQAAGYPRYENVEEQMVKGALRGALIGWLFGRRKQR